MNGKHLTSATIILATLCLTAATLTSTCPGLAQEETPRPEAPVARQELPAGQEPAAPTFDLRYAPQVDSERRYVLTARGPASATFQDGTELGKLDLQISAELLVQVTEVKERTFVISASVESASIDASGVVVDTPDVGDAHPTLELTPSGELVSTTLGESLLAAFGLKGIDDYLVAALASIIRLPDGPTSIGGSWESRLQTGPDDAGIVTTATSTLTSADEQTARITSNVTCELPAMELSAMNFQINVHGGQLKLGKFVVALDRAQSAVTSAEGMLQLSLRGDFQQMPLNIDADVDVKAKPWEAPTEVAPEQGQSPSVDD